MRNFIKGLPKAELHLHLEGSLEPQQMFDFAQRNKVSIPFESVEEVTAAYHFSNLQDFLNIYYVGMKVLVEEIDFYQLTESYLRKVALDNAKHVEVFFDPQGHTERGVEFFTVINGISQALEDVGKELKISSRLIMCFLRHLSEESAMQTLDIAQDHLDNIHGVGLDSSELGNPPDKFKNVFARAKQLGLHLVAHAGEEGPADYVWQALDVLGVDRIDHGNRSLEDNELVKRLADKQIPLTVCPLSNLQLCVVNSMDQHPLKKMLDKSLLATLNSDDPSYFGGYLNDNFLAVSTALNLTQEDLVILAKNSFKGSFLADIEKHRYINEIDQYYKNYQEA
ncbi:MAG: adenosine deaminase [Acidiferrobacterales bacterium]|nr:adenosine deaminase [Acidiferrobacterales bacterium]